MQLQVVWVEVPVKEIDRAQKFYETVFDVKSDGITDDGVRKITTFRIGEGQAGITLNQTANFEPRDNGVLIYVMTDDPIKEALQKIEEAGGAIVTEPDAMGDAFYAIFKDTEGNVLALYAMK